MTKITLLAHGELDGRHILLWSISSTWRVISSSTTELIFCFTGCASPVSMLCNVPFAACGHFGLTANTSSYFLIILINSSLLYWVRPRFILRFSILGSHTSGVEVSNANDSKMHALANGSPPSIVAVGFFQTAPSRTC